MRVLGKLGLALVCVPTSLALAHYTLPEDILFGTIEYQREAVAAGQIKVEELSAAYLERIGAIDESGPVLNSMLAIAPDALTRPAKWMQPRVRWR